jgi:uncharacterized membrane protein
MRTPANIARHPIHPMLVPIPIGLWVFSLICDLVYVFGGHGENWAIVAYYTMVGGVLGALIAAVPGFIDMLALPRGFRRTALAHMAINLTVVGLYAFNIWLRFDESRDMTLPVSLSAIAVALLVASGWLGGKMVYVHGIAVADAGRRSAAPRPYHGIERRSHARG